MKAEFIRRLVDTGLEAIELTSFVPPSWIPQLGDAEELLELLGPLAGRHPVLVPNERGLDRALGAGVTEVAVFGSATETLCPAQPEPVRGCVVGDVRARRRSGS